MEMKLIACITETKVERKETTHGFGCSSIQHHYMFDANATILLLHTCVLLVRQYTLK